MKTGQESRPTMVSIMKIEDSVNALNLAKRKVTLRWGNSVGTAETFCLMALLF